MLLSLRREDELAHLATLLFSFDMDNAERSTSSTGGPVSSGSRTRRRTRSGDQPDHPNPSTVTTATWPANHLRPDPFTMDNPQQPIIPSTTFFAEYIPGIPESGSPHDIVNHATARMQGGNLFTAFPNAQAPPPPYPSHVALWPFTPQQYVSNVPLPDVSHGFATHQSQGHPLYPAFQTGSGHRTPSQASALAGPSAFQIPSPTASSPEQPLDDTNEAAIQEDKRRRNTAASARFRIKKKQKGLSLERTVSDLTSRAEELEREATNLRRENSWLKEMVIMKGRQNMTERRDSRGKENSAVSEENDEDSTPEDPVNNGDSNLVEKRAGQTGKGKGKEKADNSRKDKKDKEKKRKEK